MVNESDVLRIFIQQMLDDVGVYGEITYKGDEIRVAFPSTLEYPHPTITITKQKNNYFDGEWLIDGFNQEPDAIHAYNEVHEIINLNDPESLKKAEDALELFLDYYREP